LEKYEPNDALMNYYSKHLLSIPHVNRLARFNPDLDLTYPVNPAGLLAALSLRIPEDCSPKHIDDFLRTDMVLPKAG
jgi:hypothetical protein